MSSIASFAIRRTAASTVFKQAQQARYLASGTIPIDVDHYTSGWDQSSIKDIGEFSKAGKYQIQTFNKISEKVSFHVIVLFFYLYLSDTIHTSLFVFKLFGIKITDETFMQYLPNFFRSLYPKQ